MRNGPTVQPPDMLQKISLLSGVEPVHEDTHEQFRQQVGG